jgi:hypothetical protein
VSCTAECVATPITTCKSGDGCCPSGANCTAATDNDCSSPTDPCRACEEADHGNRNCPDSLFRCENFVGTATVGTGAGKLNADLCKAEVACIHRTKCAAAAPSDCVCGDGVDPFDCFTGATPLSGACKDEVIAAAYSAVPADLNTRFFDPQFPSGAADTVIETCDAFFCVKECLGK